MKTLKKMTAGTLLAFAFTSPSHAAQTTTTFAVTATVLTSCVVVATPLAFASITFSGDVDANNAITVTCTPGTAYDIGLDAGNGSGATVSNRKMTNLLSSDTLEYSLYQASDYSTVWGDTVGTDTVSGTGGPNIHTVYGRIPGSQNVPAGNYLDTITVTVTY